MLIRFLIVDVWEVLKMQFETAFGYDIIAL